MGKQILITGGAGFLGSHLCEKLLKDGCEVLCIDNLFTGERNNIASLLSNPLFEFMRHDVTFPLYVEVDQIFNMACPASPIHYQYDPVQTTKTSVHGAINMPEYSRLQPARSMVIQHNIHKKSLTGAMLIQSVPEVVMMKESGVQKPCFLITFANIISILK